jgi:hypothetical protein
VRVNKPSKIRRQTVELRPSRIRREPPPAVRPQKLVTAYPSEREVLVVVVGVILFGIAITALAFDISYMTS